MWRQLDGPVSPAQGPMFGRRFAEETPEGGYSGAILSAGTGGAVDQEFRLGPWVVRPSLNTVSRNGSNLRLEPKAMEVLVCLAQHGGSSYPRRN